MTQTDRPSPPTAAPSGALADPPVRGLAWRIAPTLLAALGAIVYLVVQPRSVDLAAHAYRAGLFGREGFTLWDGGWYAGHHTPGYSVLFPPLAWLLGPALAGALAAVAAAGLFELLARGAFGERGRFGALWFGLASVTLLLSGRLAFALGVSFGLAALVGLQRRRALLAIVLAVATGLASPVAALFLAIAAVACALARRRREALGVAAAASLAPAALALAFPEGGYEPFAISAFWPLPVLALLTYALLPRAERVLRAGTIVYALAGVAAFALHTPMGGNALRLGQLCGGPVLAGALAGAPRRARAATLAGALALAVLAWWQWSPAVGDVAKVSGERSVQASFYKPLLSALARAGGPPGRVEIPFTRGHWEAAEVAPRFPLARGWERQLDVGRNGLFYGRAPLTASSYLAWLRSRAVRWVALPNAPLDNSAQGERRLIEGGLPYLILRWRSRDWRLYRLTSPQPLVAPAAGADVRLARLANSTLTLRAVRPGRAVVAVAWSPYWRLDGGCVSRAGAWTGIVAARRGRLTLRISFALGRLVEHGRRCG